MNNARFLKLLIWINCAVPAVLLIWDAWRGQLGADPVNFAIRTTGLLSLIYLMGSLFVTPLRLLTGWNWLVPHRRTLGLYAAFFAFAHFGIFFWWDRQHDIASTWTEIKSRVYIRYGMVALLVFIPLAITSTGGMIRRLGPKNWKWLHRLVYVAAIFGAIHYLNIGKFPSTQAIVFAYIFGGLLLFRYVATYVQLWRGAKKPAPVLAATTSRPKFWTGQLKLARVFEETPEVRTFRFVPVAGNALPFDYMPGQYLNLMLQVDGKPVKRSYTIASSPTRAGYCELTVKREAMGVSSRHLHDTIKEGDVLNVSAPAGKFTFTGEEAQSVVLIAAGVGITPLMSKLRYLTDRSWPGEIFFIYVTRGERDIIFRRELEQLDRRFPNLHITISLTRADDDWKGARGRLSPELLNDAVPNIASHRIHICGPDQMAADTRMLLMSMGVPENQVKFESFTPAAGAVDAAVTSKPIDEAMAANSEATVTFARSGQSAVIDGKVVLEVAEDLGIPIDYDCRSGICGQCKVKLISGQVIMETQDALTAKDRADNIILCCQSRCVNDIQIDA